MLHSPTWTRRQLLKSSAGALAGAFAASGCRPRSPGRDRPDVLFIIGDDLNDWTGALGGHPQAKTPNLDRLAAGGTLFTSAHCSSSTCNPARTSVLTGIPAMVHGLYGNGIPFRTHLPDAITLPQQFRRHGYRTLGGGKVFHLVADEPSWVEDFKPEERWPEPRPKNGISKRFDWGPFDIDPMETSDGQLVSWAKTRFGEAHPEPLFLAVGFSRPHLPWFAPRDFFAPFPLETTQLPLVRDDDLDDIPQEGRAMTAIPSNDHRVIVERGLWPQAVNAYLANVYYLDWLVGELLEAFEPRRQNGGIVVFWSDHGFHLGQKHHWRKWTLWRESTRVPLILSAPGRADSGARCDRPVTTTALGATLLELCGLDEPWGQVPSLTRLLDDPADDDSPPAIVGLRKHGALLKDNWRYIRYVSGGEELYDLARDPYEWTNLAKLPEHAELKAELSKLLPNSHVIEGGFDDDDR